MSRIIKNLYPFSIKVVNLTKNSDVYGVCPKFSEINIPWANSGDKIAFYYKNARGMVRMITTPTVIYPSLKSITIGELSQYSAGKLSEKYDTLVIKNMCPWKYSVYIDGQYIGDVNPANIEQISRQLTFDEPKPKFKEMIINTERLEKGSILQFISYDNKLNFYVELTENNYVVIGDKIFKNQQHSYH